jgi:hypothetical protein
MSSPLPTRSAAAEVDEIAHNVAKYPAGNALQTADAGEQLAQAVLDHHFKSCTTTNQN